MSRLTTLKSPLQRIKPRLQAQPITTERLRGRAAMDRSARIKLRDLYTCRACGRVTRALEVDHIAPLWQGGSDTDANLQCLCIACHAIKTAGEAGQRANVGQSAGL
ncbi:MAG TPA: HNH endonuclease signature motif containing protein [Rhodanobacteraceae bacterium]|nr:HNH endonuclease signature motif containing protein [Rhodanobacteraceae bacterium]